MCESPFGAAFLCTVLGLKACFSRRLPITQRQVEVVAHDPTWGAAFAAEAARLQVALAGDSTGDGTSDSKVLAVYHIGSTAVPGIVAKPIIDIMPVVRNIAQVDAANLAMQELGYEAMGEFGMVGRRFFRKDTQGKRSHHVHVFALGSEHIMRHLALRDYLRVHPHEAACYSDLKQQLAAAHAQDIAAYMDGKHALIKELEQNALRWAQR